METLTRNRHVIAACIGSVGILLAMSLLGFGPVLGIASGAALGAGALLFLSPEDILAEMLLKAGIGRRAETIAPALEEARARTERLRAAGTRAPPRLAAALDILAGRATALIAEVVRKPDLYTGLRNLLVHQLAYAERAVLALGRLQELDAADPAKAEQVARTLDALGQVFIEQQRRLGAPDAIDLEVSLAMLERDIRDRLSADASIRRPEAQTH
jgi:hypothetical protein